MPLYEFECLECGFVFEKLVRASSEKQSIQCPACSSPKIEEKLSSFSSSTKADGNCAPSGG